MNSIDNAIARLQDIVLSSSDTTIKKAPDYPVSDASDLPLAIAYVAEGNGTVGDGTMAKLLVTINVDVHFARVNMKDTYQRITAFAIEYARRLAGDPTLNGTIDTIVFPINWNIAATRWNTVVTQMVSFKIVVKTLETPITTP